MKRCRGKRNLKGLLGINQNYDWAKNSAAKVLKSKQLNLF